VSVEWERVRDVGAWLAERGTKRTREHAFTRKILAWPYCAHCGLMLLKNEPTRRAARAKCVVYE
jgi:hypothetical protein